MPIRYTVNATKDELAKAFYNKFPAKFHDKVDGECVMSWEQAQENAPTYLKRIYAAIDDATHQ